MQRLGQQQNRQAALAALRQVVRPRSPPAPRARGLVPRVTATCHAAVRAVADHEGCGSVARPLPSPAGWRVSLGESPLGPWGPSRAVCTGVPCPPTTGHRRAAGAAARVVLSRCTLREGFSAPGRHQPSVTSAPVPRFAGAFTLRQRMLNFVQNIQYYMMFEVMEPTWHVLEKNLKSVSSGFTCCSPGKALAGRPCLQGQVLGRVSVPVQRRLGPGRRRPGLHACVRQGCIWGCPASSR